MVGCLQGLCLFTYSLADTNYRAVFLLQTLGRYSHSLRRSLGALHLYDNPSPEGSLQQKGQMSDSSVAFTNVC